MKPREAQDDRLWTVADVAAYLRVSRSWVYHQSATGVLPTLRFGAAIRFSPQAIRAFAEGEAAPIATVHSLTTRRNASQS